MTSDLIKQCERLSIALIAICVGTICFSRAESQKLLVLPHQSGLIRSVNFQSKQYLVCEVDPHRYKIELFNRLPNGEGAYTFSRIAKEKKKALIFAMNAGMYEKDLSPVGLFIADGKTEKEINLRTDVPGNFYQLKPNGVFMMGNDDEPSVLTTERYVKASRKAKTATQSGPMLVVDGAININFQPGSVNLNIRNGVGVNSKRQIVLVISMQPVNFYEFAQFFKTAMGCDNALYLDGVISQYFAPELQTEPLTGVPLGTFLTVSYLR